MKAIIKKTVVFLLFTLLLCLFSAAAFADGETDGNAAVAEVVSLNDLTLTLYENGDLIISGTGPIPDGEYYGKNLLTLFSTNVPVQKVVVQSGVTAIGSYAFQWFNELSSVELSDSVTSIGDYAFYCCSQLESISLPDRLSSIGTYAFWSCPSLEQITIPGGVSVICPYTFSYCTNLSGVVLPDSLTSIGDYAFDHCPALTAIDFPDGLTAVGDKAFRECGLLSVTIPDSLTGIDASFCFCNALEEIRISPDHPTFFLDDEGVLYTRDRTSLIFAPLSLAGNYEILSGVTKIAYGTFQNCSALTGIVIPESVASIDSDAFLLCSGLTSVAVPESVQSIGDRAFSGCSSLAHINIPANVSEISYGVFKDCDLLTTAGPNDSGCHIEFGWEDSIPGNAFSGDNDLSEIVFPEGISTIGPGAFSGCGLEELNLPETVISVDSSAFGSCGNLKKVKLSGGMASVPGFSFSFCFNLQSVYIPAGITSIGFYAFYGCDELDTVCYEGSQTDWSGIQIDDYNDPLQSVHIYFGCATPDPARTVRLPEDLSVIETEAFARTDAQTIVIPATVGTIDARAFAECPQLQCLCFEGSPNRIDESIVADCGAITVFAAEGSSAEGWAETHEFAFIAR